MRPNPELPQPDSEDTCGLLDRAAGGEGDAIGELLVRCRPRLVAFVDLHMDQAVRARVDPSDVVQEAQAELTRRLGDYLHRRPMPFHLWARKTAYERLLKARRAHRAARRDVGREVAGADRSSVAYVLVAPGPAAGEAADAREKAEQVAGAVQTLSGGTGRSC